MFHRKLDLLLRLTGTSNSALGNAVSMAPSYISKLRSGSRALPHNPTFLKPICDYFARRLTTADQTKTISSLMDINEPFPAEPQERSDLIFQWLTAKAPAPPETGAFPQKAEQVYNEPSLDVMTRTTTSAAPRSLKLYFGISGRREAVLRLLSEVASQNKPQTLLLYSDDSLEWLIGDPRYAKLWSDRMLQLFQAGHRLLTIHSSHRSADEMYRTLRAWLPLYVSGSLDILYCPKVRDNLFFHNMFIAPDIAALTSFSTNSEENELLNTYYTNGSALKILTADFYSFTKQCRPLLNVCTASNTDYFWDSIKSFTNTPVSSASFSYALPAITVPVAAVESVQKRCGVIFPELYTRFEVGLLQQLQTHECYDTFALPNIENVLSGRVGFPMAQMIGNDQITYTVEELCCQIEFIIFLTETFSSYHPYILRKCDQEYSVFVKEGRGVIISSTKRVKGSELHLIQMNALSYEYWKYLETCRASQNVIGDRGVILNMLRDYLSELRSSANARSLKSAE